MIEVPVLPVAPTTRTFCLVAALMFEVEKRLFSSMLEYFDASSSIYAQF